MFNLCRKANIIKQTKNTASLWDSVCILCVFEMISTCLFDYYFDLSASWYSHHNESEDQLILTEHRMDSVAWGDVRTFARLWVKASAGCQTAAVVMHMLPRPWIGTGRSIYTSADSVSWWRRTCSLAIGTLLQETEHWKRWQIMYKTHRGESSHFILRDYGR